MAGVEKLAKGPNKPMVVSLKTQQILQRAYIVDGFANTNRTGMAGWATLWEGRDSLQATVVGYLAVKKSVA